MHRNLNKIADEIKDTKPSPKNGIKVLILLVVVALIVLLCYFLNKKMRNYIDNDKSLALTQARQGRFNLLTKNSFVKFQDEETERSVVEDIENSPKKYVS